jgi:hypothetical protein
MPNEEAKGIKGAKQDSPKQKRDGTAESQQILVGSRLARNSDERMYVFGSGMMGEPPKE